MHFTVRRWTDLFPELRRALAHLEPDEAKIPFHSTVTGGHLSGKLLNAEYWWRNIREPVLFEKAIKGMVREGVHIFVEIGPHSVLRRYIQECLTDGGANGRVMTQPVLRGDDSHRSESIRLRARRWSRARR
jgi:phthiocerol/phenolphthiocerol synthesis type-I polyketide synthase C